MNAAVRPDEEDVPQTGEDMLAAIQQAIGQRRGAPDPDWQKCQAEPTGLWHEAHAQADKVLLQADAFILRKQMELAAQLAALAAAVAAAAGPRAGQAGRLAWLAGCEFTLWPLGGKGLAGLLLAILVGIGVIVPGSGVAAWLLRERPPAVVVAPAAAGQK